MPPLNFKSRMVEGFLGKGVRKKALNLYTNNEATMAEEILHFVQ